MFKRRGSAMEPCGTQDKVFKQLLNSEPTMCAYFQYKYVIQ